MLCYDYAIDRATIFPMAGEYPVQMGQPGVTLDGLDGVLGGSVTGVPGTAGIDTPGAASLDSYIASTAPDIAQFDVNNQLAFFGGPPIEAIMDTSEQGTDGQRVRVRGIRPVTDAQSFLVSCSRRENLAQTPIYVTEVSPPRAGIAPFNVSTRYSRGRLHILAGTPWTYAAGLEPTFAMEGAL
jgi:hypothetical protein